MGANVSVTTATARARGLLTRWTAGVALRSRVDGRGGLIGRLGEELARERERWILWSPVATALGVHAAVSASYGFGASGGLGVWWIWWACMGVCGFLWLRGIRGDWRATATLMYVCMPFALGLLLVGLRLGGWESAARVEAPMSGVWAEGIAQDVEPWRAGESEGGVSLILKEARLSTPEGVLGEGELRLRVYARDGGGVISGDWAAFSAEVKPSSGPAAPGGYDFARRDWFREIGGAAFARGRVRTYEREEAGVVERWGNGVNELRRSLAGKMMEAGGGSQAGAFGAALLTGVRGYMGKGTLESLRGSGLAHLATISGLHMGLAALLGYWLARLIASVFLASRGRGSLIATSLTAFGFASVYLMLSGGATSALRAYVMTTIVLAALACGRRAVTVRNVSLAATVLLCLSPGSMYEAGFTMSFAATAALAAWYEGNRGKTGYMKGVLVCSLVAGLASGVFAASAFNRAPIYGLLGNLIAVPLTALFAAPLGGLGLMLASVGWEAGPWRLATWVLEGLLWWAGVVSSLPYAEAGTSSYGVGVYWAVVFGGIWLVVWRGAWRRWGAYAALGALCWHGLFGGGGPEALIAPGGRNLAVRGLDGRLELARGRAETYVTNTWLRMEGDLRTSKEAAKGCGKEGCVLTSRGGLRAGLALRREFFEKCGDLDVLVSAYRAPFGACGGALLVDGRRRGGTAIEKRGGVWRVVGSGD